MPDHALLEIVLRLCAATAAGIALGLNRWMHGHETGMRTLGLVALGAAATTAGVATMPVLLPSLDAQSRVIQGAVQGVLAGIGLLGAGVILRTPHERRVRGVTTAANVWATAALGVVFGLGQWMLGAVMLALALLLLVVVAWIERAVAPKRASGAQGPAAEEGS